MSGRKISLSQPVPAVPNAQSQDNGPSSPPTEWGRDDGHGASFWRNRLFEGGLVLALALYYLVGNSNIKLPFLQFLHVNPLLSLPFLLLFAVLAWQRLPMAVALLPLSLPYYLVQKEVVGSLQFSLVEITLWTCLAVAGLQWVVQRRRWPYASSLAQLRQRLGPFLWPILVFVVMSCVSIVIAYARANALRAFREEVLGPLLYLALALICLRTRRDVVRLLVALFSTGLMIALLGILQYVFFKSTITADASGLKRIATVYGSGNSIGLLFDYTLPVGLAFVFSRRFWQKRLVAFVLCLPLFFVLILSDSRGSWQFAIPLATLFIIAFAIRNAKRLLVACLVCIVLCSTVLVLYHGQIYDYVFNGHSNQHGQSTVTKRIYLWESAWAMIHDSPWLGYGLDNWLCHYSNSYSNRCLYPVPVPTKDRFDAKGHWIPVPPHPELHAYMIQKDENGVDTGLSDEPGLSHPHNIFLHVWVSIGIFGLLAFVAILAGFFWLFARILLYLRRVPGENNERWRWMAIAVGAAMLAACVQGLGDSAFLEQDLAFCFWILVTVLLLVRALAGVSWQYVFLSKLPTSHGPSSVA